MKKKTNNIKLFFTLALSLSLSLSLSFSSNDDEEDLAYDLLVVAFSRLGCCLFLDIHFFGGGRKIEKKKRLSEKVRVGSKGCSTNNKKRVSAFSPPNSPAVSSGLMNSGMCELDLERRTRRAFSGSRKAHSRAVSPFFFWFRVGRARTSRRGPKK